MVVVEGEEVEEKEKTLVVQEEELYTRMWMVVEQNDGGQGWWRSMS